MASGWLKLAAAFLLASTLTWLLRASELSCFCFALTFPVSSSRFSPVRTRWQWEGSVNTGLIMKVLSLKCVVSADLEHQMCLFIPAEPFIYFSIYLPAFVSIFSSPARPFFNSSPSSFSSLGFLCQIESDLKRQTSRHSIYLMSDAAMAHFHVNKTPIC